MCCWSSSDHGDIALSWSSTTEHHSNILRRPNLSVAVTSSDALFQYNRQSRKLRSGTVPSRLLKSYNLAWRCRETTLSHDLMF